MKTKYLSSGTIENLADQLLTKYESQVGPLYPPIPVERIAENCLDLMLEWNTIPEKKDEIIFAGLCPNQKKVVFNEKRKEYYESSSGLYNTVLGHEIGHWTLHADKNEPDLQPRLPGVELNTDYIFRSESPCNSREWQAHQFMGYLLLPYRFLRGYIELGDIYSWAGLYEMRKKFNVTISALTIRLNKLDLIYIEDKIIYTSKAEAKGQIRLV